MGPRPIRGDPVGIQRLFLCLGSNVRFYDKTYIGLYLNICILLIKIA